MDGLVSFYRGRRVFVTGHTGFKGAWLCSALADMGAEVTGFALAPPTEPSLFELAGLAGRMNSVTGDVRDRAALAAAASAARPDIVIHLAAQPIVRESYERPAETYDTNVMGTVNLLEAARLCGARSVLNVTTDKVYRNNEWEWGYRESDALDGYDPYSNSKSCSELVTAAYRRSFMREAGCAVSTARAGNVIGGGDFARDRIIPDCVRAMLRGEPVRLRNPNSVRPFQHVLEPVFAYLLIAMRQYEDALLAGSWNIGPSDEGCVTTGELTGMFCRAWGDGARFTSEREPGPHEAEFLKLDCSHICAALGWSPCWNIEKAVGMTVRWTKNWVSGGDCAAEIHRQTEEYLQCSKK